MAHAQVQLVAVIGAAVRDQQHLGPGLGQGLGHFGPPGVLADRAADAQAVQAIGAADRADVEQPPFVEQLLVRQFVLEHPRRHPAAPEDPIGVVEPVLLGIGAADADGGAVDAIPRQIDDMCHGLLREAGLQHQILGLVAGDEHLGQGQQVGAGLARPGPCLARLGGIAWQVAHGRVQLSKGDAERVGHGASLPDLAPVDRRRRGKGKVGLCAGAPLAINRWQKQQRGGVQHP